MQHDPPRTYQQLLTHAAGQLGAIGDNPLLDAELLLSRALDRPRAHLRAWPEKQPDTEQLAQFETLLARRLQGEPMAHILGEREFWSLNLQVSPDTLIPRPDTEILVETALEKIPKSRPCQVLDLGTGTGAIALAIKQERPLADVWASDVSPGALLVAEDNARRLSLDVTFRSGDWWQPFENRRFDVAVSNPPYIPDADKHLQSGDLRFEPRSALASGPDGLDAIRVLINGARRHLVPGGWLLFEHGYDQSEAVGELLVMAGFENTGNHKDLAGHIRVSFAQQPQ